MDLKQTLQADASNPTELTIFTSVDLSTSEVVRMFPLLSSNEMSALRTPGVASNARVTRPEQQPQVMPEIER